MDKAFEDAIRILVDLISPNTTPDGALKFTQATLNLAHALATLRTVPKHSGRAD